MSNSYVNRGGLAVPQKAFGICAWKLPDGTLLMDADENILCAEGPVGSGKIERMVAEAAAYWSDNAGGKPHWVPGARKVSDDELDHQKGRLLDGLIPDEYEEILDPDKRMNGGF